MRRTVVLPAGCLASLASLVMATPAGAQPAPVQKVTGPQARYWVSAETATGLSMAAMQGGGGIGGIMGALMGGGAGSARKSLRLDLGGDRAGNPAEALHSLPEGMGMGASLPLIGPERVQRSEPVERDVPEMPRDTPKGRMLFFWGCGENAGAGQPVVLDFAQMAQGVVPANLRSVALPSLRSGPSAGRDRGFADWPNRKDTTAVPPRASLVGDHRVQGNFTPDIRFTVGAAHDYMEPLSLKQAPLPSGAQQLQWNRVATALGYFATAMGTKDRGADGHDMVIWNSSAARLLGGDQLLGFLPPAETERLIRSNVVMKPDTTECAVSKEALAAAGGQLVMVNLNAFGPELNVVYPPRPEDPKVTWEQQYAVKLRLRSFTGSLGGMEASAERSPATPEAPAQTKSDKPASPTDQVKNVLRGIFGR